jgi:hypothetical protein
MASEDWDDFDFGDGPFGDGQAGSAAFVRNGYIADRFPLRYRWGKSILDPEYGPPKNVADVLLRLQWWMRDKGEDQPKCWPSQQTISDACRWSREHTNQVLKEAERLGWLVIEKNAGPGGTNVYRPAIPLPPEKQWPNASIDAYTSQSDAPDPKVRQSSPRRRIKLETDPPY